MDEDKKENFRMEIVKKGLVFAAIQYVELFSQMCSWNCEITY